MKIFTKYTSFFWASLLGILGFAVACNKTTEEYGVPVANYKIKGKIVSSENQQEITGIEAVLESQLNGSNHKIGELLTNNKGDFSFFAEAHMRDRNTFYIKFTDIDGETNGAFQSKEIQVIFENPVFTGGDGTWNEGTAEKDLGTISLDPQK